jgi:hypothetical protein
MLHDLNRFDKYGWYWRRIVLFFLCIYNKRNYSSSPKETEGPFRCGTYLEHIGVCVEEGGQAPAADIRLCLDVQVLVPHFDLGQLNPHSAPYITRNRRKIITYHLCLFETEGKSSHIIYVCLQANKVRDGNSLAFGFD